MEAIMKISKTCNRFFTGMVIAAALLFVYSYAEAALTSGNEYSVTMSKVNSDGSVTDLSTTSSTADSNGKITFSFSNVPTSPDTNFLVLTVKDSSGTVVRKSFVPAPPDGVTGQLGVNALSTTQTDMILQSLSGAGTDDPIVVAYGLILTRTPNLSDSEVTGIATLGRTAIKNGFENFLTGNGVTAAQLQTFKEKLVYNQPDKDLSNFTTLFKSAVDNPSQATDDMAKAGGLIADIFIDAGIASGIDLGLIQAAHDAAGEVVESDPDASAAFNAFSTDTKSAIESAMGTFFIRVAAMKIKTSYTDALNALNASGTQITTFNLAVQAMMTAMENLDKQYSQYYEDPTLLTALVQEQMNTAYSSAFETFQAAIAASNSDITQMKSNIATALGMQLSDLPPDMGSYYDFNGQAQNWPIPQVVAFNWVASLVGDGGDLSYDRAAVAAAMPVPSLNMGWLNGSGTRSDFTSGGTPASFASLMGIQEDIMVAEHTRWVIWDGGQQPTREEEKAAGLAYTNNIGTIVSSLGGTTDGASAISDIQKKALVKMMEHPELN